MRSVAQLDPAYIARLATLNRYIKAPGVAQTVLDLLAGYDPAALCCQPDDEGRASPFQIWAQYASRALYVAGRYETCIELCAFALARGVGWVGHGEGYIRCRAALCRRELGDLIGAARALAALCALPIERRWYVYHALSECALALDAPLEAYIHTAHAAVQYRADDPAYTSWRVFWQGARVCETLNCPHLARLHVAMTISMLLAARRPVEIAIQVQVEALPLDMYALQRPAAIFGEIRAIWDQVVSIDAAFAAHGVLPHPP